MDNVSYRIDITTWDRHQKKWVPYVADDVVLEFVMLDPYIRTPLEHVKGTSTYMKDFKVNFLTALSYNANFLYPDPR